MTFNQIHRDITNPPPHNPQTNTFQFPARFPANLPQMRMRLLFRHPVSALQNRLRPIGQPPFLHFLFQPLRQLFQLEAGRSRLQNSFHVARNRIPRTRVLPAAQQTSHPIRNFGIHQPQFQIRHLARKFRISASHLRGGPHRFNGAGNPIQVRPHLPQFGFIRKREHQRSIHLLPSYRWPF